jgi:toxin ParE1/3/4
MTSYVLSPLAQFDIDGIWDFTAERWGEDQAIRYVRLLRDAIETVARKPQLGRPCDQIRSGYRKYPSGSHMIFHRTLADGIDVVRVLHQSMDFEQHL